MSKKKNEVEETPFTEEGTPVVEVSTEVAEEILNREFRLGSVVKVVNGRQLVGCIGTISEILDNSVKLAIVFPGPSVGTVETSDKSFAIVRF
jgi:hypothetical protein